MSYFRHRVPMAEFTLLLPMRGYEFSQGIFGNDPDELLLPMRGYENLLQVLIPGELHVTSPHAGL